MDIRTMPEEYRVIIEKSHELNIRAAELKRKKDRSNKEDTELESIKTSQKDLAEQKKVVLLNYLGELSKEVNTHGFKFSLHKFVDKKGHDVFTLDKKSNASFFAAKQLQQNISKTFKVKQSSRHSIMANVKIFMNSKTPMYVIRTDITSFYESIPQDRLLHLLYGNNLLSDKSKVLIKGVLYEYERMKDSSSVQTKKGIPRGIGVSSYLSELYMRDIDDDIAGRREVMFYARYVDDIFIILSSLPARKTIIEYYNDLTAEFAKYGLTLKQPDDAAGKCRLMSLTKESQTEKPMDFLGYCLYISRSGMAMTTSYGLSTNKKEKYRKKIDNAINHFETLSKWNIKQAYHDLFDSLNMITGNYKLYKSKSGVKVGLYYNNDLLDRKEDLDELTNYLKKHNIVPYSGLKDRQTVVMNLCKRISRIDFFDRWGKRKMYSFSIKRIQEIQEWLLKERK